MKSSIISIFIFFPLLSWSQVSFEGKPSAIARLNTPEGQNYLVLNPFKREIAFTEERGGGKTDEEDYKVYNRDILDNQWRVFIFSDWLNEKGLFSPIGFDKSGALFYNQTIFDKGIYRPLIKKTSLNGNVEEVVIPFLNNKSPIQSGCISSDQNYMILSLESNYTKGVEDLYVVKKKADGTWSSTSNLGSSINTAYQEITPHLSADNKTLFFATNGRGGEGSFDIFYSVRLDESWRNWSEPVSVGTDVNTSGAETSFSFIDGDDWAYFITSKNSDGYGDIMRIKIKEEIEADTLSTDVAESVMELVENSEDEESLIAKELEKDGIFIQVTDSETNNALAAELIIKSERRSSENGLFEIDSLLDEEVEIKSKGYLPKLVVLSELKAGNNMVSLSSIAVGHTIQLDHVLFYRGTSNMIEGSEKELNLVVEMMNDNPDINILLKGHTDNQGDQVVNRRLSEARVKSVREYMLRQGINAFRIRGVGYGGLKPIASNETEESRKLNRRVEFEVVKD